MKGKDSISPVPSGFDRVAFAYDMLAKLVFGNQLNRAKERFFSHIRQGERVLIMGGGTGWILPNVLERVGENGKIVFVEASEKMLNKARHRISQHPLQKNVHFLHGTHHMIPPQLTFDQIHTHFFLDLFDQTELERTVDLLNQFLSTSGKWFVTDFSPPTHSWNLAGRCLIRLMYLFFRILCGIQSSRLPDYQTALIQAGLQEMKEKKVWNGMIGSFLYIKRESSSKL